MLSVSQESVRGVCKHHGAAMNVLSHGQRRYAVNLIKERTFRIGFSTPAESD